jgi:hypothetical protein
MAHGSTSKPLALLIAVLVAGCSQGRRAPDGRSNAATLTQAAAAADDDGDGDGDEPDDSLRVLATEELTPSIQRIAQQILEEHHEQPLGHEVPFELEGKRYVGRLEKHYHPPGSGREPVGEHVGVTVYVVE